MLVLLPLGLLADDDSRRLSAAACSPGVIAFAVFFVLHLVSPRSMGFGDVKLSFTLGLALGCIGWGEMVLGLFLGFLYGAVIGIMLIATKLRGQEPGRALRSVPRRRRDHRAAGGDADPRLVPGQLTARRPVAPGAN